MPDVLAEAYVRLRALNDGSFEKDARDTLVPAAGRIVGDLARVAAGVKLFSFAKEGIAELGDAEKAAAQTAAVIKSTGGAANVTAGHVDELADSLLKLSGKDDEAIKQGENLLLTFKNIRNEAGAGNDIFDQTTKAALDLSVAFGQDMSASALQLGKALDDPVRGLTALQRIGVRFSQDQVDLIKNLVATGQTLEAQKVILKEVESQVGGSAEAYGKTLPGQLERAQESMKNTKAALVGSLAPAMELGASLASGLAEKIQELPEPLQETLGAVVLVGGGIASLARPVSDIVGLYSKWKTVQDAAKVSAEALAAAETEAAAAAGAESGAIAGVIGGLGLAAAATGIAVGVYSAFKDTLSSNETAVDEYTAAIEKNTGTLQENVDAVTASKLANSDAANEANDVGISYADMFKAVRDGTDDWGSYARELDKAREAEAQHTNTTRTVGDALRAAGAESTEFGRILIAQADAGNLNAQQAHALVKELEGLHNGYEVGIGKAKDFASAQAGVDEASGTATVTLEEQTTALKKLQDAYLSLSGQTISAFEAEIRLNEARISARGKIDEATKATKDRSLSEDELQTKIDAAYSAIINEAQANEQVYESQVKAAGGAVDAATANNKLIEELQGVANTLAPGSPLKQQILDYIAKLQSVPTTVSTTATLDSAAAIQAVIDFERVLNGIPVGVDLQMRLTTGPGGRTQRASGGPVAAGEIFQGAEAGRELALLNTNDLYQMPTDAYILDNATTEQLFAGGGSSGGAGGPLTVVVPLSIDGREFARATVEYTAAELRQRERARR